MFTQPGHTISLSQKLSKVLDDIGVNDDMVRKRRQTVLLEESLRTVTGNLKDKKITTYNFGSRTEGTTTAGLQPDSDTLVCNHTFNIIQDLGQWREGYTNLLMVCDARTPPGYCLLQKTWDNVPQPVDYPPNEHFICDRYGRVLMKNNWFVNGIPEGGIRNGPSVSILGLPGFADDDLVHAFFCKSWPREARTWVETSSKRNWPTEELKRQAVKDGCFVVPVGVPGTEEEELQWRISTNLTERRIMFSLNIVQIRCHVLMKMILKSYLPNMVSNKALSSFICKTVLLHCIETEGENLWQDDNLLNCLNVCLKFLHECILSEQCPHFVIRENNLMAHRISPDVKPQILDIIEYILNSNGQALLEIEIDQLGIRISEQYQRVYPGCIISLQVPSPIDYKLDISGHLLYDFMNSLSNTLCAYLLRLTNMQTETVVKTLSEDIDKKLANFHSEGNDHKQTACELLSPFLYMTMGSVAASRSISRNEAISQNSLVILEQVSTNDFSSALKWASVFYCKGDIPWTMYILDQIKEQYTTECLQSVCCCYQSPDRGGPTQRFKKISAEGDIKQVLKHTAFCVRYLPCEVNCVPEELQNEYFRSDLRTCQNNREQRDPWMDWAVVDSIPYYYFLQYKVHKKQGNRERQQEAFEKLRQATDNDSNLGHRETALNLLAQCMEQENMIDDALNCYRNSTYLRPVHNAAYSISSHVM